MLLAAEDRREERARDRRDALASETFHPDLQRIEAKRDVLIQQVRRRFGARYRSELEEALERELVELLDSAGTQLLVRHFVRERQSRNLRADAVDFPADPALLAEQRDPLDVASHRWMFRKIANSRTPRL